MNRLISTRTAITKTSLSKFIGEVIREGFRVYWKYDKKLIYLVVTDDTTFTDIAFERNPHFLTLTLNELSISDQILFSKLQDLIVSNGGFLDFHEVGEYQVMINVLNLEINYWLMELQERITSNDPVAIERAKIKLTTYTNELNYIREKVKAYEPTKTV